MSGTVVAAVTDMLLWFLCGFFSISGFLGLWADVSVIREKYATGQKIQVLRRVSVFLLNFQNILRSGGVPGEEMMQQLASLESPWREVIGRSIERLREGGAELTPVLLRFRSLADDASRTVQQASVRISQSLSQALIVALLIPLTGYALYQMIPGLNQQSGIWMGMTTIASMAGVGGIFWILHLSNRAAFGNLAPARADWLVIVPCAGEEFLSLIRSGHPPDIAWFTVCEGLARNPVTRPLTEYWGVRLWEQGQSEGVWRLPAGTVLESLAECGREIRKCVQISLMEGRPCISSVESVLDLNRVQVTSRIEGGLEQLPARCMKPLFLLIAPAIFTLLFGGLALAFRSVSGGLD